jgi:hypothetical protein
VTADELLKDMNARIDRGVAELLAMANDLDATGTGSLNDSLRLRAKATGMLVVKDWLRSYWGAA